MNLAAGVLALLAVIISAVSAVLPTETKTAFAAQIREKALSVLTVASVVVAILCLSFFNLPLVGLAIIAIYTLLVSVKYLNGKLPASRAETFVFVVQLVLASSFFFLYMLSRIVTALEKINA